MNQLSAEKSAHVGATACVCSEDTRKRRGVRIARDNTVFCLACHGVIDDPRDVPSDMRWDGIGWQHWDGEQWVFAANGTESKEVGIGKPVVDQRGAALAGIAHGFNLCVPVAPALIIRATAGRNDEFVRHHSTEAANFGLTNLVVWVAALLAGIFLLVADPTWKINVLPWIAIGVLAWATMYVYLTALAVSRSAGSRWMRYPFSVRIFKGALVPEPFSRELAAIV